MSGPGGGVDWNSRNGVKPAIRENPVDDYGLFKQYASAADIAGAVTRATYKDWKQNYLPVALQMMDQTTWKNPELITEGVQSAVSDVNNSFDAQAGVQERTLGRYGMTVTPEQKAVNDRVNNLSRSSATVDAAARIRQKLSDRNYAIAMGGIPKIGG